MLVGKLCLFPALVVATSACMYIYVIPSPYFFEASYCPWKLHDQFSGLSLTNHHSSLRPPSLTSITNLTSLSRLASLTSLTSHTSLTSLMHFIGQRFQNQECNDKPSPASINTLPGSKGTQSHHWRTGSITVQTHHFSFPLPYYTVVKYGLKPP